MRKADKAAAICNAGEASCVLVTRTSGARVAFVIALKRGVAPKRVARVEIGHPKARPGHPLSSFLRHELLSAGSIVRHTTAKLTPFDSLAALAAFVLFLFQSRPVNQT